MKNNIYSRIMVCNLILMVCMVALPVRAAASALGLAEGAGKLFSKTAPAVMHSKATLRMLISIEKAGGGALRARAEKLAAQHGANAIKVLVKDPKTLVPTLERFSFSDQAKLLGALSRKPNLIAATGRFGDSALKLELRSGGDAMGIIRTFGADGLKLTEKLSDKQIAQLALLSDRFKTSSKEIIKEFLKMVSNHTARVFGWLEHHPRVLYTAAAAGLVYSMKTELFGDPSTKSSGAVQRMTSSVVNGLTGMVISVLLALAPWVMGGVVLWLCFSWLRRPRPATSSAEKKSRRFWSFHRKPEDKPIDVVAS